MKFLTLLSLIGAFATVTFSAPLPGELDTRDAAPHVTAPGFSPRDYLSPLTKRAPQLIFKNCSPEQERKIKRALWRVVNLSQSIINNGIAANTLAYQRIFGHRLIGPLVPAPQGPLSPDIQQALHPTVVRKIFMILTSRSFSPID